MCAATLLAVSLSFGEADQVSAGSSAGRPAQPTQPNIVLILTDDHRLERDPESGVERFMEFPDGTPVMPNVRSLIAEQGVEFENAFVVNPLCCPSRASILTGGYSHTTDLYNNRNGPHGGFRWFDDSSTVATWLDAAGYRTGMVGKYLNGYWGDQARYVPPGWDRWVALSSPGGDGQFYHYDLNVDGSTVSHAGEPEDYSTDVLAGYAESFIRDTPVDESLFLHFSVKAPHWPATPAPRHDHLFSGQPEYRPPSYDEDDVSDKPEYIRALGQLDAARERTIDEFRLDQYRSLVAVDEAVGGIVAALEETGRLEDTLLVFLSDNGLTWAEHRWKKNKNVPYEEAIQIPLVMRYDPLVQAPRMDDRLVLNIDLAPTFAEIAGVEAPGADGVSLLPLLGDPDHAIGGRTDFLIEHLSGADVPKYCGVRSERFSYVAYDTAEEELYDMAADPFQLTNVIGDPAYAQDVEAMRTRLRELCDPVPPPITLSALTWSVAPGHAARIGGRLSFPLDGPMAGQVIHVVRAETGGASVGLPDQITDEVGEFSIVDTPPGPGDYTYLATWDGDAEHGPATEPVAIQVTSLSRKADFNGDGFEDLAIGVPSEDVGSSVDAGAVHVAYGAGGVLDPGAAQNWTEDTPGVPGTSAPGDAFGSTLAAGDFNGDGFSDLAVGVPQDDGPGAEDAGSVVILPGGSSGLGTAGAQVWSFDTVNVGLVPQAADDFGRAMAAGDLDADGYEDLAVGAPGRDVKGVPDAGAVSLLSGGPRGLIPAVDSLWTESTNGAGLREAGDRFGQAIARSDVNGDGFDDLAIGIPSEDVGRVEDAGAVAIASGSPTGLVDGFGQVLHQDRSGMRDRAEPGDRFGAALAGADFDGDGFDDLAVGVASEDLGTIADAGAVAVVYGTSSGLHPARNRLLTQDTPGIAERAESGDGFGGTVSTGDLKGDGFGDLAVGVAFEDVGGHVDAGSVSLVFGSSSGLAPAGNLSLHQNSHGMVEAAEPGDAFGTVVALADVNGDTFVDLAVGVPGEDLAGRDDAGAVSLVPGSPSGPGPDGNVLLSQVGSGDAEAGDRFGSAIAAPPAPG